MSTDRPLVRTALGKQPLANGIVYTHEHLWIDLTTAGDSQAKLDQLDAVLDEVRELQNLGVAAIMELTCLGMGRDARQLARIQRATGVQIIPATGYYHRGFHPPALTSATVEEIEANLRRELTEGIDGTTITPMLLGEIGGSGPPLHPVEVKVFQAVAQVAQAFPTVVTTHAHLGGGGSEELRLLLRAGLEPGRILIGHLDLCPALEEVLSIARQGAFVGIDTVGKTGYASDERRVSYVQALVRAGLADRILLSCDISRNKYLRQQGGQGYAYLLRVFLPMLAAAGLSPAIIRQITEENPRRFLAAARVFP